MTDSDDKPSSKPEGDLDLEPMPRDPRFIVRLVLMLIVGFIGASFVGLKLKGMAAGCGSGLVQPGSSVVPPPEPATH